MYQQFQETLGLLQLQAYQYVKRINILIAFHCHRVCCSPKSLALVSDCSCKAAARLHHTLPCIPACAALMDAEQQPPCPSQTAEPKH